MQCTSMDCSGSTALRQQCMWKMFSQGRPMSGSLLVKDSMFRWRLRILLTEGAAVCTRLHNSWQLCRDSACTPTSTLYCVRDEVFRRQETVPRPLWQHDVDISRRRSSQGPLEAGLKESNFHCRGEVHRRAKSGQGPRAVHLDQEDAGRVHGVGTRLALILETTGCFVWISLLGCALKLKVGFLENLFLPDTGGRYLKTGKMCPDYCGRNEFILRVGKNPRKLMIVEKAKDSCFWSARSQTSTFTTPWKTRRSWPSWSRWKK